jgi:hypothetical protein
MKHDAADRFVRDTRRGCHSKERFVLFHHTLYPGRPVRSGKTVCWPLWTGAPLLDLSRRRADVMCSIVSEQVLYFEIQFARRNKEEEENW